MKIIAIFVMCFNAVSLSKCHLRTKMRSTRMGEDYLIHYQSLRYTQWCPQVLRLNETMVCHQGHL